jgi:hypothetical protein
LIEQSFAVARSYQKPISRYEDKSDRLPSRRTAGRNCRLSPALA